MRKFGGWFMLYFAAAFLLLYLAPVVDYFSYATVFAYFGLLFVYLCDIFAHLSREENDDFFRENYLKADEMIRRNGKFQSVTLPVLKFAFGALAMCLLSFLFIRGIGGFVSYALIAVGTAIIGFGLYADISGKGFNLKRLNSWPEKKRYVIRKMLILVYLTVFILGAAYLTPLFFGS
jgi:hypothetical protein